MSVLTATTVLTGTFAVLWLGIHYGSKWVDRMLPPPAIPKLGPYGEGCAAWSAGILETECPYVEGGGDDSEWLEGWRSMKRENGQFGVGA